MPPLADSDSSAAVVFKVSHFRVFTALEHGVPATISPRLGLGVIMRPSISVAEFRARAATNCIAASKPRNADNALGAAFTSAQPARATSLHVVKVNRCQLAERLICDVEPTHDVYSTTIMEAA
jgi:hypothetical protein